MELVGDAVHAFLAADVQAWSDDERDQLAARILKAWNVTQLEPVSLILASNRLNDFIQASYPQSKLMPECQITAQVNHQRLTGRIDLLIDTPDGFIILDHKTFPGAEICGLRKPCHIRRNLMPTESR